MAKDESHIEDRISIARLPTDPGVLERGLKPKKHHSGEKKQEGNIFFSPCVFDASYLLLKRFNSYLTY
jgi:hypothetical protein